MLSVRHTVLLVPTSNNFHSASLLAPEMALVTKEIKGVIGTITSPVFAYSFDGILPEKKHKYKS